MADAFALVPVLRLDGAWLRCPDCDDAFWGAHRPTDFVQVKLDAHRVKAHGAAGRPQRRAAAAKAPQAAPQAAAGLLVNEGILAGLGAGVARRGFAAGDVILKRAHSGQEAHNLAEYRGFMSAPAHIRRWLCPVIACAPDGSWLLMRKAERVGRCESRDVERVQVALDKWVRDLHRGNIGLVDGQPVATDYAGGWQAHTPEWAA